MRITSDKTVGEVVATDLRLSAVFDKYGIDFCCGGGRSIEETCRKKNIDPELLLEKLNEMLNSTVDKTIDFNNWPIDLLADYIEKKHHRYVREQIPVIQKFLEKLCKVHGERHNELFKINELFLAVSAELQNHMLKEELVLFPYIRKTVTGTKEEINDLPQLNSIENPIKVMIEEHETAGDLFNKIAELTDNYTAPADACNTYRAAFALLREFESDLHIHIHLENNILFPKAIKSESDAVRY